MLFIKEGIDLAGVFYSDFQGIQINFALPRPAGFANFCGAGRGSPFSAGRGGVGRGAHPWTAVVIKERDVLCELEGEELPWQCCGKNTRGRECF